MRIDFRVEMHCPFCGEFMAEIEMDASQGDKRGRVVCGNCGACGPDVRTNYCNAPGEPWHKEAIARWEERHVKGTGGPSPYCRQCHERQEQESAWR